jgi:cytochrome oxidase assembly protein ShyY1
VLEVLRQRRWLGFTLFIVAMLALCVVLARWQWSRYQVRLAENDRLDAALSAEPVDVGALIDAQPGDAPAASFDRALEWSTISATGTFDTAGEAAVRRRPLDGRNGFWIVTPLVTDSGVLLVNRGWTPAGDTTQAPQVPPPPAGQVTVVGRLRLPETTGTTDPPPAGQAWATDPQALVTPASTPRYNAYLELRSSDPSADEGLTTLDDPGHRGLNNLVYSVQWLLFGLVAVIGWWRLIRVEGRREDDAQDVAHAHADPDTGPDTATGAGISTTSSSTGAGAAAPVAAAPSVRPVDPPIDHDDRP